MTRTFKHSPSTVMAMCVMLLVVSCQSHRNLATTEPNSMGHETTTVDKDWENLDITLDHYDNKRLYQEIKRWLGTPYLYGGHSRKGTDCSGFVMEVYKKVYQVDIERSSAKIFEKNCEEIRLTQLREGDLVFFNTSNNPSQGVNHVAIYLKHNKIAHATSSRGVIVSDMKQKYWVQHYLFAGRVITQ